MASYKKHNGMILVKQADDSYPMFKCGTILNAAGEELPRLYVNRTRQAKDGASPASEADILKHDPDAVFS